MGLGVFVSPSDVACGCCGSAIRADLVVALGTVKST